MQTKSTGSKILAILGWVAIVLFVGIYIVELLPHHGPPVTVRWIRDTFGQSGLIILNIVIVLAFLALLPFRRPTKNVWKSHGAFFAFVIALMTEMFGWPLVIFILSPLFEVPQIARSFFSAVGHWPSIVTLILWPILIAAYVWLAKFEERLAIEEFGEAYTEYAAITKRFVPMVV